MMYNHGATILLDFGHDRIHNVPLGLLFVKILDFRVHFAQLTSTLEFWCWMSDSVKCWSPINFQVPLKFGLGPVHNVRVAAVQSCTLYNCIFFKWKILITALHTRVLVVQVWDFTLTVPHGLASSYKVLDLVLSIMSPRQLSEISFLILLT